MSFLEHLDELRKRIVNALIAVAVGVLVGFFFIARISEFLLGPTRRLLPPGSKMIYTQPGEAFGFNVQIALIAGVVFATPVIAYQIWMFVAPGLYDQEKRYARPFVFFATIFFILGAAFCYWVVFPVGYRFFIEEYQSIGVSPAIRISEYLSFSARMLLAFGVTFEMPVITFFLARMGMVTHQTMLSYLRYAVLVIFIVAAVLTPGPDVASQLLMAGPLLVLYGISIAVAYFFATPRAAAAEQTADGAAEDS